MSELHRLIKNLCPDGVEYVKLSDIASYSKTRISVDNLNKNNYISVENLLPDKAGKINTISLPKECNCIYYPVDTVLIGNIRPYLRKIWLSDCDGGTNSDVLPVVINDKNKMIPKFLFYVLSSENFFFYDIQNSKGTKMPRGDKIAIMNFSVPVPPLVVQREIVNILDNFTELIELVKRETELRQKQYEYYRNKLLTFGDDIEYKTLDEICIIRRGNYITKKDVKYGNIPVIIGGQKPAYYCDRFNHNGEAVVISRSGASAGFVSYWNEPIFVTDGFAYEGKEYLCTRYLYFVLKNMQSRLNKMKRGGGIPHIQGKTLEKIKIPVPPTEEQEKIVKILDNFTKIIELSERETELRQKQYEYYRDRLLNFKEKQ